MTQIIHKYKCDVCGKPRAQGNHYSCSKKRQKEYFEQFESKFECDERFFNLCKRLNQYYRETETCPAGYAVGRWKIFRRWARDRGYTQDEVNRAKKESHKYANGESVL